MLLRVRSWHRRRRLVLLVLVGLALAVALRCYRAVFPAVRLPQRATTQRWSKAAQDEVTRRLRQTSAWWRDRSLGRPDDLLLDVTNETLGFQDIFVVNLPLRTDRSDALALAASLTGLRLTMSPGVAGADVDDRVLPPDSASRHITSGNKGSWRAHINVLRTIVERNITTALIMEDDVDWDVRIKAQMMSFALAARAYGQPLVGSDRSSAYWHTPPFDGAPIVAGAGGKPPPPPPPPPSPPPPPLMRKGQTAPSANNGRPAAVTHKGREARSRDKAWAHVQQHSMPLETAPHHQIPIISPYGDDWDVLWLGHCGTEFPTTPPSLARRPDELGSDGQPPLAHTDNGSGGDGGDGDEGGGPTAAPAQLSLLRVMLADDDTVPRPQDMRPHPFALPDALAELYPPHTRAVHAASGTVCTQAYAVSQRGARKLLYQLGLASFTAGYDLMLRDWCDGMYRQGPGALPRRTRRHKTDDDAHGTYGTTADARAATSAGSAAGPLAAAAEPLPQCLTVQPPLFSHYLRPRGAGSDIQAPGGGLLHRIGSQYIRLSVQRNLRRLVHGASIDALEDQWPDVP